MQIEEFINIARAEGLTKEEAEHMWEVRPPQVDLGEDDPNSAIFARKTIAKIVRLVVPVYIEIRKLKGTNNGD